MKLSDQDAADIISALQDAQKELCIDHSGAGRFPASTAQWNRWNALIKRFKFGATSDE